MFVADLGGEVAMGLRRLPTLANHCAQRASFALLQGKWIEFRELTYTFTVLSVLTGGFIWPNWLDDAAPKIDRRRPGWLSTVGAGRLLALL